MTNIIPFCFEGTAVRIIDRDGEPWFVLADVCRALEHSDPHRAADRLDDDEKIKVDLDTLQPIENIARTSVTGSKINALEAWAINESGLYSLILTSRKPAAKRFKKWVTAEVLPTIRKTGSYGTPAPAITEGRIREIVALEIADLLRDQRAVLVEGFVTAHDIRAQHVPDLKHGPKPSAISVKLAAYAERTGNQSAMTRERGGLRPRRLFSLVLANSWLRSEGAAWIKAAADKRRGQGVLRLIPKSSQPENPT